MKDNNLSDLLDFAREIAWDAGQLTLGYFQSGVRPDWKADQTPVTVADRDAEALIRQRIESKFPSHAIVGEEHGLKESQGSSFRWIIDPIDGTKSFIRGVPMYGVLIGLEIDEEVQVGIAHFPALNEMVSAATGLGCYLNGRRAWVSDKTKLEESYLIHINYRTFETHGKGAAFERLSSRAYFNAGWCDAYGYALVATGRAEIACDPIMNVWDCGPFPPIFAEAGGYFGDWAGNRTIYAEEALGTTNPLLDVVLATIQG